MSRFLLVSILLLSLATLCCSQEDLAAPPFASVPPVPDVPLSSSPSASLSPSLLSVPDDSRHTLVGSRLPARLVASERRAPPLSVPSNLTASVHSFHPMQSGGTATFIMEMMTENAPWSPRIQPALLYQEHEITFRNWRTNVQVSTGDNWLLFFEGALFRAFVNDSEAAVENDVWASMDDGQTWDLVGGISRYGQSGLVYSRIPNSFPPRAGSNNCEDPVSDRIFSLAGFRLNISSSGVWNGGFIGTTAAYLSTDAKQWQTWFPTFQPNRFFSSCDVDVNGHVYSMGGVNINNANQQQSLLNDVWHTGGGGWTRATGSAPWAARAEHLTVIASNTPINKEIIYVIGGMVEYQNNGGYTQQANDVWASSDQGVTWTQLVANNAANSFHKRWGHGGVVTKAGVILLFGGSNSDSGFYSQTYSYRDVWASFDGGFAWHSCNLPGGPSGPDEVKQFIRTEQGASVNGRGQLLIASGYSYDGSGGRWDYNDVWRTPFSIEDPQVLASMCGGSAVIPRAGIGMRQWPRVANPSITNTFIMTALTHRAPWSARIQPAVLLMSRPITYTQVRTGLTISTPSPWLLLYEGSLTYTTPYGIATNENDVWASADNGATWDLIAGITRNGSRGYLEAANAFSSFTGRGASGNCEDPASDDVYSLGGYSYIPGTNDQSGASNDVWYSSDAITWTLQTQRSSFSPPRAWTSCDIDDHGEFMWIMGGIVPPPAGTGQASRLLNDVWRGTNKGRQWERVDTDATGEEIDPAGHWAPRAEHSVLLHHNTALKVDVLYVMGGWVSYDLRTPPRVTTINDVWVSSDGGVTWKELTGYGTESVTANMWPKRWGHSSFVTEKGVLLVAGGTDTRTGSPAQYVTYKDLWASFDGGYNWFPCRLPTNADFIRAEQSMQVTADERLLLVSGYSYNNGSQGFGRNDYSDVFISNVSLADTATLINICGGEQAAPPRGTMGLSRWPGAGTAETAKKTGPLSGAAIAGIVFSILIVVAVLGYCVSGYQKTGHWPIPFVGGPSGSYDPSVAGSTDYSAFSFGTKNEGGVQSADTNGTNGVNGGQHGQSEQDSSTQYLS